jgi:hypothetical protein
MAIRRRSRGGVDWATGLLLLLLLLPACAGSARQPRMGAGREGDSFVGSAPPRSAPPAAAEVVAVAPEPVPPAAEPVAAERPDSRPPVALPQAYVELGKEFLMRFGSGEDRKKFSQSVKEAVAPEAIRPTVEKAEEAEGEAACGTEEA